MPPEALLPARAREVDVPELLMEARILPSSVNVEARTAEIVFSTGAQVLRRQWFGDNYLEELSLEPSAVRMDRFESGRAPVLNSHSTFSLSDVVGVIESASLRGSGDSREGVAVIRFSKREDVEAIFRDVIDGILVNISVGYRVYRVEEISSDDENAIKVVRVVDWEPMEVSLVAVGADSDSFVRSDHQAHQPNKCVVLDARSPGETMNPEQLTKFRAAASTAKLPASMVDAIVARGITLELALEEVRAFEEAVAQVGAAPAPDAARSGAPATPAAAPAATPDADAVRESGRVEERARQAAIRSAGQKAGVPLERVQALIDSNVTIDAAREAIIDLMATRDAAAETVGARATVGLEAPEQRRAAIENALLHRAGVASELTEQGRHFRFMPMIRQAEELLELRGVRCGGMTPDEIARRAFHTTGDFASILGVLSNANLRTAYEEAPRTFLPLSRRRNIGDFRDINVLQLDVGPGLDKVEEHGEFTYGTIGEGKEVYSLATYGKIFGLSRQAMVNDDLDAFTRIPTLFGRAAARKENDLFWANVTGNILMADGTALFASGHSNLEGTPSALAIASLSTARAAMRLQTAIDGTTLLNVTARSLVVPAALETTAQQLTADITADQAGNVNPFRTAFRNVIAEPRLDADSATAFYMVADPAEFDTFEHAYLDGRDGVFIETREGFEVDGMEFKARHDFGTRPVEHRGVYKNAGA